MAKTVLVTGGAGFIGSHFVDLLVESEYHVVVLDKLTYAGNQENLRTVLETGRAQLVEGDICDNDLVGQLFKEHSFSGVLNFAAESHVDRSIEGPDIFIKTNIEGTFNLLRHAENYFSKSGNLDFRFLQVSTDEVFGELPFNKEKFSEKSSYSPNSPYSASKASADHLARAWNHTYGLPVIVTNCSNNYGPRQFPEKLIPLMINNAIKGKSLPVYGAGKNVRDWIHVKDHCRGVLLAFECAEPGSTYCFGGNEEHSNIEIVKLICKQLDDLLPSASGSYVDQIQFVEDRKGHDLRYAIDDSRAVKELGFTRDFDFNTGLLDTIKWYLEKV